MKNINKYSTLKKNELLEKLNLLFIEKHNLILRTKDNKVKNNNILRNIKKNIARIKTILNFKYKN